jgi:hypothetical protein
MTKEERLENAHILDGFTVYNTDGVVEVLLEGIKGEKDPVTIVTPLKTLENAVEAIKEELNKEIKGEGE